MEEEEGGCNPNLVEEEEAGWVEEEGGCSPVEAADAASVICEKWERTLRSVPKSSATDRGM